MRMRLDAGRPRAIGRIRAVAFKTQNACGLHQVGVVFRPVYVVATETGHAVGVHQAGDEIVALHPVLVRGAVGEMGERCRAEFGFLELPEIFQGESGLKANRPVVILAGHRVRTHERLALGVALDAGVAGLHDGRAGREQRLGVGRFGVGSGDDVAVGIGRAAERRRLAHRLAGDGEFEERAFLPCLRGLLAVTDALAQMPASRVVPGHGPLIEAWPQGLAPQRRYFERLLADVRELIARGAPIDVAAQTAGQAEKGYWELFEDYNARNATAAYAELEWE